MIQSKIYILTSFLLLGLAYCTSDDYKLGDYHKLYRNLVSVNVKSNDYTLTDYQKSASVYGKSNDHTLTGYKKSSTSLNEKSAYITPTSYQKTASVYGNDHTLPNYKKSSTSLNEKSAYTTPSNYKKSTSVYEKSNDHTLTGYKKSSTSLNEKSVYTTPTNYQKTASSVYEKSNDHTLTGYKKSSTSLNEKSASTTPTNYQKTASSVYGKSNDHTLTDFKKSSTSLNEKSASTIPTNYQKSAVNTISNDFSLADYQKPAPTQKSHNLTPIDDTEKPIIHTFISTHKVESASDILLKDESIKIWAESWKKAGFNPIILTMKDANTHPGYKEVISKLSAANIDKARWDRYLRFIAMSHRGGGWLSDISILPLRSNDGNSEDYGKIPYGGKFTIHDGNSIPQLMSGNRKEWNRMAKAMLNEPNNDDNQLMKSLLQQDSNFFNVEDSIISSIHLFKSTDVDVCQLLSSGKVVAAKYQYRIAKMLRIPRQRYYDAVHASLAQASSKCSNKETLALSNERELVHNKDSIELSTSNEYERPFSNEEQADTMQLSAMNEDQSLLRSNKPVVDVKDTIQFSHENEYERPFSNNEQTLDATNTMQLSIQNENRPKMHTFFQPAYGKYDNLLRQVEVWKKAWEEAGWEAIVLTFKDAQSHSYFNRFERAFDNAKYPVDDYNRMCFYRWLAMAESGGGWMSDYDTMPIHSNPTESLVLPNGGQFTSFQKHVPALIVGSADEWNRMSKLMYKFYQMNEGDFYSDMLALRDIQQETKSCVFDNFEVISPEKIYQNELVKTGVIADPYSFDKICGRLNRVRAVHFSHAGCHEVKFCARAREEAVERWMDEWREQCVIHARVE